MSSWFFDVVPKTLPFFFSLGCEGPDFLSSADFDMTRVQSVLSFAELSTSVNFILTSLEKPIRECSSEAMS